MTSSFLVPSFGTQRVTHNPVFSKACVPSVISLFERAFKRTKNGVYFIVIALLVAELFKMTCDVTLWAQNDVKSQKMEYLLRLFFFV